MQDVDVNGTPIEEQSRSRQAADQAAGAVSLLIKIGHKVKPCSPCTEFLRHPMSGFRFIQCGLLIIIQMRLLNELQGEGSGCDQPSSLHRVQ